MSSQPTIAKTMAIVQLTRLGDVVQTLQAAMEMKKENPGLKLIYIGREDLSRPLEFKLREVFNEIFYLNTRHLFMTGDNLNLDAVVRNIRKLATKISNENIDVLVNLSFSKTSSYLCSLIKATHRLGLYRDRNGNLRINDNWSKYVYASVMDGPLNPFSLVDIYKSILGVQGNSYNKDHLKLKTRKIIIHPFSSQTKKSWRAEKWSEVVYHILKNHEGSSVYVMGSKADIEKSEEILHTPILEKYSNRIVNLTGQTTIQEIFDEFLDATLFIGHDSVGGHLASLFNVQTLTISLGSVRPHETTPYGANNYNIIPKVKGAAVFSQENDLNVTHKDISYKAINSTIDLLLTRGEVTKEDLETEELMNTFSGIELYRTYFNNSEQLSLMPLVYEKSDTADCFRTFFNVLWSYTFSYKEVNTPFPIANLPTIEALQSMQQGLSSYFELCEFGQVYSKRILEEVQSETPDIRKIKEYSAKIDEVDQLALILKGTYHYIAPLINYYHVVKANLVGEGLLQLSQQSYLTYTDASNSASVIYELLQQTIDMNLPKDTKATKSMPQT